MRAFAPYISAFIVAGLAYSVLTRTGAELCDQPACGNVALFGLNCLNHILLNPERGLEAPCRDGIWRNPQVLFATLSAVGIGIGAAVCAGVIWLFGGDQEEDIGGR